MYLQSLKNNSYYTTNNNRVFRDNVPIIKHSGLLLNLNKSTLLERLIRQKIHNLIIGDDNIITITKGLISVFSSTGDFLSRFIIDRGSRPLRQGVVLIDSLLVYGDYWSNPERVPVNLYCIDIKTMTKRVLATFNHIRHIHCVHIDKRDSGYVFVGTGDKNSESGIYRISLSTGERQTVAEGAQKFRAVSLLQQENTLIWGSDSPTTQNAIYRFDLSKKNGVERVDSIDGPAYYSTRNADGILFIATTIENRIHHKAIIYRSADSGGSWSIYKSFVKDIWNTKYFGYGVIEFVEGQERESKLHYNLIGLKEVV